MIFEKSVETWATERSKCILHLDGVCICKRIPDNRNIFKFRSDKADVSIKNYLTKKERK